MCSKTQENVTILAEDGIIAKEKSTTNKNKGVKPTALSQTKCGSPFSLSGIGKESVTTLLGSK